MCSVCFCVCVCENCHIKVERSSHLTSFWPWLKYIWSATIFLAVHLLPLRSLSCGPDGTLSALWATAIEAWLYCNVSGCSRRTDRQEALGEMNGLERLGGQIGRGDKGTMAARVPSRLVVEWPLQASLEASPHTHTAGCKSRGGRRKMDRWAAETYSI